MVLEEQMLELLGRIWINGWTGQMVQKAIFIISRVIPITGIVSCSSTTNIGCTDFCVTQRTMILGSNYVLYAFTPLSGSMKPIEESWTGLSNGAAI
jgi:hypothetical protein